MREENEYVLGTHQKELERLGFQHQVWARQAQEAWEYAGFSQGHKILDLGSGPGFATMELARIVGHHGRIYAVDKSEYYVKYVQASARQAGLPIEAICTDFSKMQFESNSLDGVYDRWAMAWIDNVESVLRAVNVALKPGGKVIFQEYFDWSTFQTQPRKAGIERCKKAILESFRNSTGNINIGRLLPQMLAELGLRILRLRPLSRMCSPGDISWHWPKTFLETYLPRVAEMNLLSEDELNMALKDWAELEKSENSIFFAPQMIEVIAQK